jgi:NAD(P)-dependent dehydrogenase (short-subunit alcohol dehydrogenase family)
MGKLEGKVAVITGGSSGLALESAKRFVEEGAYVFITGRRQEALDEAVKLIGRNVTGVRGDASNLDDLDVCSTQSSGKRTRSTSCLRAQARAKPPNWARLPSSTSMRAST